MKNILLNYFTLVIIYVALAFFVIYQFNTNVSVNPYNISGLILMPVSLVFFTMARIKLGRAFQVSAEANKLVKDGIYRVIRHPIYVFGFTFILGFILFMQQFYVLIVLLVLIPVQMNRVKKEEKVLEEKFGDEYREYKKGTWF